MVVNVNPFDSFCLNMMCPDENRPLVFIGLVDEDCVTKMRLLSLVDLASDESGKIPYTSIKDTLQVK